MPRAGPSHTLVADTADAYQRITPSSNRDQATDLDLRGSDPFAF